jgi:hypothetical protein
MNTASAANGATDVRPGVPAALLMLGAAVLLLLVGVVGFDRAIAANTAAQRELVRSEAALTEARASERRAQQNRNLLAAVQALEQHAQATAILPRTWGKRQINLVQQRLSREQINDLLMTTGRSGAQLPKPDEFEVAVTQPGEGLFDAESATRQPVALSLRGVVNFRIADR